MLSANPLLQIPSEAQTKHMPYLIVRSAVDSAIHEITTHFRIGQIFIRSLPNQHLVKNNPNAPHIALGTVNVLSITLRTHVSRRAHVVEQLRLFCLVHKLAESKVSNSGSIVGEEDVGSFEVSMDDEFVLDGEIAVSDISGNAECLELVEASLLLDVLLEISILAVLSHDIDVVLGHEYFDGPEDVGVVEGSQGVDLVIQQVFFDFTLNLRQLQHLDGNGFLSELIDSLEDLGAEATAYHFLRVIDIIFDLLHHLLLLLSHDSLPDHALQIVNISNTTQNQIIHNHTTWQIQIKTIISIILYLESMKAKQQIDKNNRHEQNPTITNKNAVRPSHQNPSKNGQHANPQRSGIPPSASSKKLASNSRNGKVEENGNNASRSNCNMSRGKYSDSFIMVDRVVQLHERLKNIHHFYKTRIEDEKNKVNQRNQVFMSIVEEMQRSHNEKVAALQKMVEEAQGEKKDVGLVDERMNEIKGSIDEILKQSADLKSKNERLERQINDKAHQLREKEEELGKLKEELMEVRNELQGFERLNLRENKRNKQIVGMIDKKSEMIANRG